MFRKPKRALKLNYGGLDSQLGRGSNYMEFQGSPCSRGIRLDSEFRGTPLITILGRGTRTLQLIWAPGRSGTGLSGSEPLEIPLKCLDSLDKKKNLTRNFSYTVTEWTITGRFRIDVTDNNIFRADSEETYIIRRGSAGGCRQSYFFKPFFDI